MPRTHLAKQVHGSVRSGHAAAWLGQQGARGSMQSRKLEAGQDGGGAQVAKEAVLIVRMHLRP